MQRVLALVVLALVGSLPTPAYATSQAASPTPHLLGAGLHALEDARHASDQLNFRPATAPTLPLRTGSAVPSANPLLRREIFGFAPYWELSTNSEWDYNLLSTIAYFGLDVNDDGGFANVGGGWNGWNSADLTTIINRAHAAGVRVVVVVKDFRDGSINSVLNIGANRQNLINGVIAAIQAKNLDGVNVDFEGSGDPRYPDIPSGITGLMTDLSSQVHARWPQAQVTIDTYAGAASWDGGIFRIRDLAPVVDAMFVMAYDSVFSNMPGQAGPNAPMNGWTYNDTIDVAQYLSKAPASKIILGVPYYGYVWSTKDGSPNAATTSGGQAVTYSGVIDDLACAQAVRTGWDDLGQSPWAVWWSPYSGDPCGANLNSTRELYFDNATSLGIKYDLVNSNNLRGMGMWALGYDSGHSELWHELAVKFTGATPWSSLGGTLTSGPGVSSWGSGGANIFARGSDNGLQQSSWNGTNLSAWAPLGGVLAGDPGAVSWGPNRIDVFVRGGDNQMWHKFSYGSGQWSGWEPLGGGLGSGPGVASWSAGRLDVFVRGTDGALWHKWWDGSRWNGWEPLGGALASDPAAVSWGPNRIDVFVRGTDNGLWHKWWDGSRWNGWEPLGGILTSAPAASSCGSGQLDVLATGSGSALMQHGFNGAWGAWGNLGGQWTSKPGAVCAAGARAVIVFERASDNALWYSVVPAS